MSSVVKTTLQRFSIQYIAGMHPTQPRLDRSAIPSLLARVAPRGPIKVTFPRINSREEMTTESRMVGLTGAEEKTVCFGSKNGGPVPELGCLRRCVFSGYGNRPLVPPPAPHFRSLTTGSPLYCFWGLPGWTRNARPTSRGGVQDGPPRSNTRIRLVPSPIRSGAPSPRRSQCINCFFDLAR